MDTMIARVYVLLAHQDAVYVLVLLSVLLVSLLPPETQLTLALATVLMAISSILTPLDSAEDALITP